VNYEQVSLESLAEAGVRLGHPDGSSFPHCGDITVKSWDLEEQCLSVLSEGGTSRLAEVVERIARAGAYGLTNVWR